MTGAEWLVTAFLVTAAAVVAWPLRNSRTRRRTVLGTARPPAPSGGATVRRWPARSSPAAGAHPTGGRLVRTRHAPGGLGNRSLGTVPRPMPTRPPGRRDPARPVGAWLATPGHLNGAPRFDSTPGGPAAGLLLEPAPEGAAAAPPLNAAVRPAGAVGQAVGALRPDSGPGSGEPPSAATPVGPVSAGLALWGADRWLARIGAGSARRRLLLAVVLGGAIGEVLVGPVAAVVLAAYAALAVRAFLRRQAGRRADQAHRRSLDQLCALAADLRAGLPVTAAVGGRAGSPPVDGSVPRQPQLPSGEEHGVGPGRITQLAQAAVRLADRTGAPLAELLERIEADARAADRGLASAAAQAAGARATAWLLAALPLGGIGLGYAIGVDPVAVLLHTPVGGASAIAAVVLQTGGLLWAERLGSPARQAG